ncbi:hypothetical protein Dsin_024201 [Dipteronia sinensis]|uniref:Gnk2-homologous domain-containing protein n=1 Tax=Dipteronia sinensis TaxID=43782 RepID=A0AAE0E1M5_9ROSI|nr:hypothetical protein Dsin_024201 [Dipteronia sinensis]
MDSTWKLFSLLSVNLLWGIYLPCVNTNSDYSNLVYKNCTSQQKFTGLSHESHSQALSILFQELLPQSSQSRFSKATAGGDNNAVSGLFQCRGDLTNRDCYECVNTLPEILSKNLCTNKDVAARIQLNGCYFHYETDEFIEETFKKHELLHKICGEKGADIGFEELRDEAFAAMESGVIDGHGFYSGDYGSVHVLAQCEGDLGGCDCGECVISAAQIAQEECIGSISGQIYLDRCSICYSYYPYGVPGNKYHHKGGGGNNTGKSVAIVLGGAAALFFGLVFLMIIKSFGKKDDI